MSFTPGQGAVIAVGVDGAAASRRDVESVADALARLNSTSVDRLGAQLTATQSRIGSLGVSAAQTTAAMRGIPAQMSDIVASLQGGQAPLTVLLQQGGQLKDMFGGAGNAARALGGYVVGLINPFTVAAVVAGGLAYAYYKGASEAKAFNQAIILSGNVAVTSAGQLSEMARQIGAITGSRGAAAEALTALVSTSKVSADNLQRFATVAIGGQQVLGRSVADTAAEFAELGKAPLAALGKIDDTYHVITASTYAHVKALQDQGRTVEAISVAQNAFADGINTQRQKVLDSLTDWERGWIRIKNAVSGAVDATLDIGRGVTPVEKMNSLLDRHFAIQAKLAAATEHGDSRDAAHWQTVLDSSSKVIAAERAKGDALKATAKAQEKVNEGDKLRKEWLGQSDILLTRAALRDRELEATRTRATAAGLTQKEIQTQLAVVQRKYNDVYVEGIDSSIEALRRRAALEDVLAKRSVSEISAARSSGTLGEAAAIEATAAVELRAFDQSRTLLERELQLAASKINSLREQAALRGQIAVLDQQQLSRRIQLLNDLSAVESKVEDAVNDKILQSILARQASNDSLQIEYALYGKSADAREAANVALKAETDLQDYIFNQQKAGLPLSDEQIKRLTLEKDARVRVTNATAGQSKALAYAAQLQAENEKFETEYIFDATSRAAAIVKIDERMWQERIQLAGEGTEAQMRLQEQYNIWSKNQIAKPQLDEWKASVENYSSVFRTGFADMLNNGKDGWKSFTKSLTTTFKTSVADQIYKMFAQPFVVKMVANLLGISGGAASGLAQAAGGTVNSGLGNAVGSGLGASGIGSSILGAGGSAIAGFGNMIGSSTVSAFGAGFAGTTSTVSSMTAAEMFSGAGMAAEASAASWGATIAAAAPYVAAIIAGVALIKSMDHSGTYHTGGASRASSAGVTTIRAEDLHFEATRTSAETEKMTAGLASGIVGILDSTALAFGKTAGYTAATAFADDTSEDGAWGGLVIDKLGQKIVDWQDTKTGSWAPKVFADGAAGQEQYLAALSSSVRTALDGIGLPEWAKTMLDGVGSGASIDDLAKVADQINKTQVALKMMGDSLVGFSTLSDKAKSALIQASGGIDNLAANASAYYNAFYTDAEKSASTIKAISDTLAAAGVSMPANQAAFKAAVEEQIKLGEAGAPAVAALFKVAQAFAQVNPVLEATATAARSAADILSERADLQNQYDELTMTALELAQKKRGQYASENRAFYDQLQAVQKLKAAQDAAKTSLGDVVSKMASFSASVRTLGDGLRIGDMSTLTSEQKYAETRRQYESTLAAAKGGDATAQGQFATIANAFLAASRTVNSSDAQYATDFNTVLATTDELAQWANGQVDVAQASLDALNRQVLGIADLNMSMQDVANAITALPAALGAAPAVAMPPPVIDYGSLGTPNTEALVAEVKALRASNESLVEEVKGLRADQNQQTGDQIVSNYDANGKAGQLIADVVSAAVDRATHASRNWKAAIED